MNALKSSIWAEALIRRARLGGAFAYLRHHGDDDAGAVFIKVTQMNGMARVLAPERDEHFRRIWVAQSPGAETEEQAEARLAQARRLDPDLWVIEIEDPQGRAFLLDDERPRQAPSHTELYGG